MVSEADWLASLTVGDEVFIPETYGFGGTIAMVRSRTAKTITAGSMTFRMSRNGHEAVHHVGRCRLTLLRPTDHRRTMAASTMARRGNDGK